MNSVLSLGLYLLFALGLSVFLGLVIWEAISAAITGELPPQGIRERIARMNAPAPIARGQYLLLTSSYFIIMAALVYVTISKHQYKALDLLSSGVVAVVWTDFFYRYHVRWRRQQQASTTSPSSHQPVNTLG